MVLYICIALASYLIGSLSLSIEISRHVLHSDIRNHGSGNAGATNMARIYGMRFALLTLAGDMMKCVVAMLIGQYLAGDLGLCISGIACILGHCFPVFYHFKGGKGVSVGGAMGFLIDWRVGLAIIITFLIVAFLTRKVSLGSCSGAAMAGIGALIFGITGPRLILAFVGMTVVIVQHRGNLKRVLNGTEPDFKPAKRQNRKESPPES